jgi:hypothetical protein
MKYTALLFGLILLNINIIFAQSFDVTGQLKDDASGDPILYSYVHVLNPADSAIAACITDDKGFFEIRLDAGTYRFAFSQLGYSQDTTAEYSVNKTGFLDVFKLRAGDMQLDEVVVQESSDKYYFDKDEQIVTSKMKEGAADTYDVLAKVNGLYYDRYNNTITVDNDDNIILLVNSLEKDISYIQNIAPERLKKVEVIRSPSGRYALEGYSAVVNIILKDDYRGVDLSYSNHGFMNFIKYPDEPLMILENTASGNFSNGKYNTYINYQHFYQGFAIPNTRTRIYSDSSFEYYTAPDNIGPYNAQIRNSDHRLSTGIDYFLSPKHTLSYELSYRSRPYDKNIVRGMYEVESNTTGDTLSEEFTNLREEGFNVLNNSLFYKGDFDSRNKLSVSYAFSLHRGTTRNTMIQNTYEHVSLTRNDRNYSVLNADYTYIFSDKLQADLAYGFIHNDLKNSFTEEAESVPGTENVFNYKDVRHRASAYFTYRPAEKLVVKGGGAAENSELSHDNFSDSRTIILPHADFSYKPLKQLQVTLKYRANANYPSINQVNPNGTYDMNGFINKGNPDLKPAVSNSVSLRMNILGGLLSAEPYYIFTDDFIINVISQNEQGQYENTFQNAGLFEKKGVRANVSFPFLKYFMFQSSADFFSLSLTYSDETRDLNDWTLNSTLIYRNRKHKTILGLVHQKRLRKYIRWDGHSFGGNDFWSVMVQQPLLNDRLNIEMFYILPTDFMASYNQGSYTETVSFTEHDYMNIDALKNMLMFKLSYRFSRGDKGRSVNKDIDLDEQQGSGLF